MASYLMEAVFTMTFGPLLACVFVYFDLEVSDIAPSHRMPNLLVNLSRTVHRCTTFLVLSVVIASVIRIQQVAPISELNFMKLLTRYQCVVSLGATISCIVVTGWHSRDSIALLVYNVILLAFYTAALSMTGFPSADAKVLEQLTVFCHDYRDWPIPVESFVEEQEKDRLIGIFFSSSIGGVLLAALIIWQYHRHFRESTQRIRDKVVNRFCSMCEWCHVRPRRVLIFSVVIGAVFWWALALFFYIVILFDQRKELQDVLGSAYADADWGFGQVTAMLLWGPLLHDLVMETIGK